MNTRTLALMLATLLAALLPVPLLAEGPVDIVTASANRLMEKLEANRDELSGNPEVARRLVREELLPIMDTTYSARLILGRAGRGATPEQVTAFANAMSTSLIDRYATGVAEFRRRDQLEVMPMRGDANERMTRVRTRVQLPDGQHVPVDYVFHKTDDGQWKAFDVIVEGISYVTTYRNQVMPQVESLGIDAVTERLKSGELKLEQ